ncbi:MAG TPA: hypothetical protein PKC43_01080 [Phycisphaerales bacterium]|nr:hypothetical protein [Phycisphaerales bacterium]HMP36019.1 hypothetical protein [Phycisphaerales bacterium]
MAHAARKADLSSTLADANIRLDGGVESIVRNAWIVGGVGIVAALAWAFLSGSGAERIGRVWIVTYSFVLSIALGGLFFTIVQHLTRAGWSVVVRRIAEAYAANLRWMWLLFAVPVLLLLVTGKFGYVFPWADLAHMREVHPDEATLVEKKTAYLNVPFFLLRSTAYLAIWAALGWFFWRRSTEQDADGGIAATERMQRWAPAGIILFGLSTTFAAFDWIMSLNPAWFSTIFGVYFFAASCTSAFAAMIVALVLLERRGKLVGVVTAEHFQDLGKLLFAFGIVFWAYIAFSQYMLIWYSNQPETTGWYIARQMGGWKWLSIALLFGHFVIPFLLLVSKHPKRYTTTLLFVAAWMLVFSWLDLYWLVMPQIPEGLATATSYRALAEENAGVSTRLADPLNWLALLGFVGLFVGSTLRTLAGHALIPVRDPRLAESLAFENM